MYKFIVFTAPTAIFVSKGCTCAVSWCLVGMKTMNMKQSERTNLGKFRFAEVKLK
jgi:hypothetical protein